MITEEDYIIEVNDTEIRCYRPDGTLDSLSWKNLRRVEVVVVADDLTEDAVPGTLFALHGPTAALVIPDGSTNADDLTERLLGLPGFAHEQFEASMSAQTPQTFLCWERSWVKEEHADPAQKSRA